MGGGFGGSVLALYPPQAEPPWAPLSVEPRAAAAASLIQDLAVDRRLAQKNLRTALIAGLIVLVVFAASFFSGYVY